MNVELLLREGLGGHLRKSGRWLAPSKSGHSGNGPIAACEIDVDTNALKTVQKICGSKVNMLLTGVNAYG
jgi:hypothetical protein